MSHSVNNKLREVDDWPILWDGTDGRGGPSFSDTWVLRMTKKWPRWQANLPMGLAPNVVLIQFFCRFGIVHDPRLELHTPFLTPKPVRKS